MSGEVKHGASLSAKGRAFFDLEDEGGELQQKCKRRRVMRVWPITCVNCVGQVYYP